MCFGQALIQFGENGGHRLNENVFHQMTCSDPGEASVTWTFGQTVQQWSIVVTQVWLRKTFIIQSRPIVMWAQSQCRAGQVELHSSFIVSRWLDAHMLKCSFTQVLIWPGQEVRRSSQKSKKMSKGLASPSSMGNVTMCQRGPIEPNSLIHMTLGHTTVLWWLSQMSRRGLVWGGRKLTPWPTTWQTLATLSLVPVCH